MTSADHLPHEDYITQVCERLGDLGIHVADGIATTPDGEVLEAAISFYARTLSLELWPGGVYLGWDQGDGWALCTEGSNRCLYPLDLDTYANPRAVAQRTADRLTDAPDSPVDEDWDGAVALQDAVDAWETVK